MIEEFVRDQNVGAGKWRMGVLTFDGNIKGKQKVTYERIHKYLEGIYDRKFAYGTIDVTDTSHRRITKVLPKLRVEHAKDSSLGITLSLVKCILPQARFYLAEMAVT